MKCFFLLRFAHFSKFSMYAWGKKGKSVSFSRVYVCIKAKLNFFTFFLCTFPLARIHFCRSHKWLEDPPGKVAGSGCFVRCRRARTKYFLFPKYSTYFKGKWQNIFIFKTLGPFQNIILICIMLLYFDLELNQQNWPLNPGQTNWRLQNYITGLLKFLNRYGT